MGHKHSKNTEASGVYGVPDVASRIVQHNLNGGTEEVDGEMILPPFAPKLKEMLDGKFYYGMRIVTGDMMGAGTDNKGVYITLVGSYSTGKLYLLKDIMSQIKTGCHCDLVIEIQIVVYGNDKGDDIIGNAWYVKYSNVYKMSDKSEKRFPCAHWIGVGEMISTTANTTTLKDVTDNLVLLRERNNQIDRRRLQYKWLLFPDLGVPSGIDDGVFNIPADEQFSAVKNIDFARDALHAATTLGIRESIITVDSLYDFITLTKSLKDHDLTVFAKLYEGSRWVTDVEFGRQMLNGVNPVVIRKCTILPANFPVTNEMVQQLFTRAATPVIEKMTLEKAMSDGRIYICDLKIMDGLTPRKGCFAPAPICLLYVNTNDQLVPIAIQLKQGVRDEEKDQPNPIFLPSDHWIDWLLAKMYYQSSHSQFHQISTHYFSCHTAMEAYSMGTMRNLPDSHPINKLLRPHFRYTMAINTRARATLVNKGGIIDILFGVGGDGTNELFRRVSKEYSVDWTNIKKNIKERGVDDPKQLPGYYYRDDGLKVWNALEEFVSDVVYKFYSSDSDVKDDLELNNFARDVHDNGFPGYFGAEQGHGFPNNISTKNDLIEQCTRIIFTGSAQHASVNFGQSFIYGYVPNAPSVMRRPAPEKKGITDFQTLLETIPDKTTGLLAMVLSYVLSGYSDDEIYLGDYPAERFTEQEVLRFIKRSKTNLNGISGEIEVRNESLDVPYDYMNPKKIPNSITI